MSNNLPEGWEEMLDQMSGKPYYFNSITNEMSFERPIASNTPQTQHKKSNMASRISHLHSNMTQNQIASDAALAARLANEDMNQRNYNSNSNNPSNNIRSPNDNAQHQIDADAAFAAALANEDMPSYKHEEPTEVLPSMSYDLRPVVMDDSEFSNCPGCGKVFTLTFRRHHCKCCGALLCSNCTSQKAFVFGKDRRVCTSCYGLLSNNLVHCLRRYFFIMTAFCESKDVKISTVGQASNRNDIKSMITGNSERFGKVSEGMFNLAVKGVNQILITIINLSNLGSKNYEDQVALSVYANILDEYAPQDFFELFAQTQQGPLSSESVEELVRMVGYLFEYSAVNAQLKMSESRYSYKSMFKAMELLRFQQGLNKCYTRLRLSGDLESPKFAVLKIFALFGGYFEVQEMFRTSGLILSAFDDIIDFTDKQKLYSLEVISRNLAGNFKNVETLIKPKSAAVQKLLIVAKSQNENVQNLALKLIVSLTDYSIVGQAGSRQAIDNLIFFNGVSDLQKVISDSSSSSIAVPVAIKVIRNVVEVNSGVVQDHFNVLCLLPYLSITVRRSDEQFLQDLSSLLCEMVLKHECLIQFLSFSGLGIVISFSEKALALFGTKNIVFLKSLEIISLCTAVEGSIFNQHVNESTVQALLNLLSKLKNNNDLSEQYTSILSNVSCVGGVISKNLLQTNAIDDLLITMSSEGVGQAEKIKVSSMLHAMFVSNVQPQLQYDDSLLTKTISIVCDMLCTQEFANSTSIKLLEVIEQILYVFLKIDNPTALSTAQMVNELSGKFLPNQVILSLNQALPVLLNFLSKEVAIGSCSLRILLTRFCVTDPSNETESNKAIAAIKNCMMNMFLDKSRGILYATRTNAVVTFFVVSSYCTSTAKEIIKEGLVFVSQLFTQLMNNVQQQRELLDLILYGLYLLLSTGKWADFISARFLQIFVDILVKGLNFGSNLTYVIDCLELLGNTSNVAIDLIHLGVFSLLFEISSAATTQENNKLFEKVLRLLAKLGLQNIQVGKAFTNVDLSLLQTLVQVLKTSDNTVSILILKIFLSMVKGSVNDFPKPVANNLLELWNDEHYKSNMSDDARNLLSEVIFGLASSSSNSGLSETVISTADIGLVKQLLERPKLSEKLRGFQLLNQVSSKSNTNLEFALKYSFSLFESSQRGERMNVDIFKQLDIENLKFLKTVLMHDLSDTIQAYKLDDLSQLTFNLELELQTISGGSFTPKNNCNAFDVVSHPDFLAVLLKLSQQSDKASDYFELIAMILLSIKCFKNEISLPEQIKTSFVAFVFKRTLHEMTNFGKPIAELLPNQVILLLCFSALKNQEKQRLVEALGSSIADGQSMLNISLSILYLAFCTKSLSISVKTCSSLLKVSNRDIMNKNPQIIKLWLSLIVLIAKTSIQSVNISNKTLVENFTFFTKEYKDTDQIEKAPYFAIIMELFDIISSNISIASLYRKCSISLVQMFKEEGKLQALLAGISSQLKQNVILKLARSQHGRIFILSLYKDKFLRLPESTGSFPSEEITFYFSVLTTCIPVVVKGLEFEEVLSVVKTLVQNIPAMIPLDNKIEFLNICLTFTIPKTDYALLLLKESYDRLKQTVSDMQFPELLLIYRIITNYNIPEDLITDMFEALKSILGQTTPTIDTAQCTLQILAYAIPKLEKPPETLFHSVENFIDHILLLKDCSMIQKELIQVGFLVGVHFSITESVIDNIQDRANVAYRRDISLREQLRLTPSKQPVPSLESKLEYL